MPNYDYQCEACSHVFEVHQSFSEEPLSKCTKCKKKKLKRLINGGLGFSIKGGVSNIQSTALGGRYVPMDSAEQKFDQRMTQLSAEGEI